MTHDEILIQTLNEAVGRLVTENINLVCQTKIANMGQDALRAENDKLRGMVNELTEAKGSTK